MTPKAILHIRYRQLQGLMQDVPILYRIAILIAMVLATRGIHLYCQSLENAIGICAGIGLSILTIHGLRTDKKWLAMYELQPWKIYLTEYLVFSSFLWLSVAFTPYFYLLPALGLCIVGISFLPQKESAKNKQVGNWLPVPKELFEWRANFRKMAYVPFFLYLLAFPACYWPYAPLVILWFVQASMVNCYNWHEPRELLESAGDSAKGFLHRKLRIHTLWWLLAIGLVLLPAAILQPKTIWLCLFFGIFSLVVQAFMIVAKYALYEPNTPLEGNQLIIGLGLYSIAIPFLLPIPLVAGIRYYRMALRNLNFYWDA